MVRSSGRGKKVANHCGNERFQDLVHAQLSEYSSATVKTNKSAVILRVLNNVRSGSSVGGFVKQDANTKRWYAIDESSARSTTAQAFRDSLSHTYKSSKQFKQQRRLKSKPFPPDSSLSVSHTKTCNGEVAFLQPHQTPSISMASVDASVVPLSSRSLVTPNGRAAYSSGSSVTDMQGLQRMLDTALGIVEDQEDQVRPLDLYAAPMATAMEKHTGNPLQELLDRFASTVEWTENPFEPTPMLPSPNSSSVILRRPWLSTNHKESKNQQPAASLCLVDAMFFQDDEHF
jgi:hypothetical protein